jgi:hypothetical protein
MIEEARKYRVHNLQASAIDLRGMRLTSVPEFVFHMPQLKVLMLGENRLTSLPERIGTLTTLTRLRLGENKLASLPESLGKLTKLTELDLMHNQLVSLPESLGKLTKLKTLELGPNKLTKLPESIGTLVSLRTLQVHWNALTEIPESIGNLRNLDSLNLNENALTKLPESIGNLQKLEYLMVRGNRLTSLPESIGRLKKLEELHLKGNTLRSVPESVRQLTARIYYDGAIPFRTQRNIRVNNTTNVFNRSFMEARLSNVPPNRRAFINKETNVKNNGTLRRIYNINGLAAFMKDRQTARLHGGPFTRNNITRLMNVPHKVNRSAYLRNIKNRLANTSLNNTRGVIDALKNNLPGNVTRTDINRVVSAVVPQKIANRLRTTPEANRARLINRFKSMGLMNR